MDSNTEILVKLVVSGSFDFKLMSAAVGAEPSRVKPARSIRRGESGLPKEDLWILEERYGDVSCLEPGVALTRAVEKWRRLTPGLAGALAEYSATASLNVVAHFPFDREGLLPAVFAEAEAVKFAAAISAYIDFDFYHS